MKIEIAEPGRMTQSGSSLLKLIQNNNMPILDLLVRESIQNSLDAGIDNSRFVNVEFITGSFDKFDLNNELEKITQPLNKRFKSDYYDYIAVRDSNTVGLTGKLHYDEVTDNNYGNLLKLIYEISKAQEAEGAGGSWGLGKTVYFRVGIGLVFYYSRIINEEGNYESRMAASLVENELLPDSMIPKIDGKSKRGIAWWGEQIGPNDTRPVTDVKYINKILSIFNISPYTESETGTTIIIPYIDKDKLLEHNQTEYTDGQNVPMKPFWNYSIEDYLKIATQRWYAPRLNNRNYKYGKFLRAKVNDEGISLHAMEPAFQVIQSLYNHAIRAVTAEDILDFEHIEVKTEDINLRNVLKSTCAGTVAYAKIPEKIFKISFPDNKPLPYMYYNCEIRNKEKNKPVLCFTRKPGMIVSYEDVGKWVNGINETIKEDFIVGIFVLNSENKLTDSTGFLSLEEYVRKSEMADHTSWGDFSIGRSNPRIVSKIQQHVSKKISSEFDDGTEENEARLNSGLGKMFGDLLLPPENFGKKPSTEKNKKGKEKKIIETHRNIKFEFNPSKTKYSENELKAYFRITSREKIEFTGIELCIDAENGEISSKEWEIKMGMVMPFQIKECSIQVRKADDENIDLKYYITDEKSEDADKFGIAKFKKSKNNCNIAIDFQMNDKHKIDMELQVILQLDRRDLKPIFSLKKGNGDI